MRGGFVKLIHQPRSGLCGFGFRRHYDKRCFPDFFITLPTKRGQIYFPMEAFTLANYVPFFDAAKSAGVTLHQPHFTAHPHRGAGGEAFVAVFTRRAQDIKTFYANPKGGRLYARRVRFG